MAIIELLLELYMKYVEDIPEDKENNSNGLVFLQNANIGLLQNGHIEKTWETVSDAINWFQGELNGR